MIEEEDLLSTGDEAERFRTTAKTKAVDYLVVHSGVDFPWRLFDEVAPSLPPSTSFRAEVRTGGRFYIFYAELGDESMQISGGDLHKCVQEVIAIDPSVNELALLVIATKHLTNLVLRASP